MKYADPVIRLFEEYPDRRFVMRQIVRHIDHLAGCADRVAIKKAVQRLLVVLVAIGYVSKRTGKTTRYVRNRDIMSLRRLVR